MNYSVLTKIDRELLKLDPEYAPPYQLKELIRARSTIRSLELKEQRGPLFPSFRTRLKNFSTSFDEKKEIRLRPALPRPSAAIKEGSVRPPRYFSRGAKAKKAPSPIPYLLIQTEEISKARPVPGNSLLLRSLAKGKGTLKKNDQGLFYLDIDNRFILSLIPYLKAFGLVRPPYFNLFGAPDGAHIPVIPPREAAFHFIDNLDETNQEFSFEIDGLYSIQPTLWPEVEEVWFFKVRSPELEALRQKNFLSSRPAGHSFHIAVAIKPRKIGRSENPPLPFMRISPAFLAA